MRMWTTPRWPPTARSASKCSWHEPAHGDYRGVLRQRRAVRDVGVAHPRAVGPRRRHHRLAGAGPARTGGRGRGGHAAGRTPAAWSLEPELLPVGGAGIDG